MERGDALLFAPLGGAGEIGLNVNLYGLGAVEDPDWLLVDLGITFSDGFPPGVDVILPDIDFIAERRDRLAGLVLTHAHEDHIGAVPYLWNRLRCPIYGTPFTLSVLREKLRETKLESKVPLHVVPMDGRFSIGPFDMEMVTLTHSIPEPNAIALHTPFGTVLHTGDWKLDPGPVVGPVAAEDSLNRLGDDGVLAIVCDSTNVFESGVSGSEADLLASLTDLFRGFRKRIAVACFASNVARLETIAKAAEANGREVVLAGRSLVRIVAAAKANGYLTDVPELLSEDAASDLAPDKTLIICTGCQGESRAALSRIAAGEHPRVRFEAGDVVVFSSRVIPGNEVPIARVQNTLIRSGVRIVTQADHFVHVSGHPARGEMINMYRMVRPRISIPVHGEPRHLAAHAKLARECGVEETVLVENGALVRVAPGKAEIIDELPVGRLAIDGTRIVRIEADSIRDRNRVVFNGSAVVTLVLNPNNSLAVAPQISTVGLLDEETGVMEAVLRDLERAVGQLSEDDMAEDDLLGETARLAVRRAFRRILGKKPVTKVQLIRL